MIFGTTTGVACSCSAHAYTILSMIFVENLDANMLTTTYLPTATCLRLTWFDLCVESQCQKSVCNPICMCLCTKCSVVPMLMLMLYSSNLWQLRSCLQTWCQCLCNTHYNSGIKLLECQCACYTVFVYYCTVVAYRYWYCLCVLHEVAVATNHFEAMNRCGTNVYAVLSTAFELQLLLPVLL